MPSGFRPLLMLPVLGLAVLAGAVPPASAQTVPPAPSLPPTTSNGRALTDAPVPSIPPERVAPADRAGSRTATDAGPLNSTPFSSVPGGQLGGGSVSPAERDRAGGTLPNLSK